jgi:hypothetical protein
MKYFNNTYIGGHMKKQHVTKATLLIALLSGGMAQADETKYIYNLLVSGNVKVPEWIRINNIYGSWNNVGSAESCGTWAVSPMTIDFGDAFQQTRSCQQAQQRNVVPILFNPVLQTTRNGDMEIEDRSVNVSQYQPSIGQRDYINGETADAWGAWISQGARYDCSDWSPEPDSMNLHVSFLQNRDCSQNQTHSRQVYHTWASGAETPKRIDDGAQTISVVEDRASSGVRDFIAGERIAPWSSWEDSGSHFGCVAWTPAVDAIDLNASFTQSRDCSQNQIGSRDIFNVWASGAETLNRIEPRAKVITEGETQPAVGTKDFITGTSAGAWSGYSNVNGAYACSGYSPNTSTVNLGSGFTQSRSCSQDQTRSRTIYNVWESGANTVNRNESGGQVVGVTQNRSAIGSTDFITGTSYGSWSGYSDVNGVYACSGYSPNTSTVNLRSGFTQSRSCSQGQNRSRTVYNVWASGATTYKSTQSSGRAIGVTTTRGATGTRNYISGTSYGSWTGYSNYGGVYSCSSYSPSTSTVNWGSGFTQSRGCSQGQDRSRTVYNVWASGATTYKNTENGSRSISVTTTRGATGSNDFITGTSYGGWSSYSNVGGVYACSGYSPSTSSVNWGGGFTQSRSCTQGQGRSRTVYNVWASGATTYRNTENGSRSTSTNQYRSATGTKDYVTGTSTGSWSSWSNSGGHYGCGSWGAATSTVNYGQSFTQYRSCSQNRVHSRAVYNNWASGARTNKTTESDSVVISVNESQGAVGTKNIISGAQSSSGAWVTGGTSCGGYTPSVTMYNYGSRFTQTRSCATTATRTTTTYNVWSNGSRTVRSTSTETNSTPSTQTRSMTGTKDYITGTYETFRGSSRSGLSCLSWSPSTDIFLVGQSFTQTRTCTSVLTRYYNVYNRWAKGGSSLKQSNKAVSVNESTSQSRSASGTQIPFDECGLRYDRFGRPFFTECR